MMNMTMDDVDDDGYYNYGLQQATSKKKSKTADEWSH